MSSRLLFYLKWILKIMGLSALALVVLGLVIGVFYGSEIKQVMIGQLNKNLAAEIKVREFDFSVLRHFPYASFDMEEVMAKEVTDRPEKDTLLYARHLSFLFNIMGVFDRNISVKKVLLTNGKAKIVIDENGKNNYHFWKSSGDSSGKSSSIDLKEIILKNISISYRNLHDHQDYLFTAKDASFSGKFSDEQYALKTSADLFVEHFYVDSVNYIVRKPAQIRSGLNVNNASGLYHFEKCFVKIADLQFDLTGELTNTKESTLLNLGITAYEADLESFISMLPPAYVKYFDSFRSKGRFLFSTTIKGNADKTTNPEVFVDFSIRDGVVEPKESSVSLEKLNMNGRYRNHASKGKSELVISSLSALMGGHAVKADLRLDDLNNPYLTLHASAEADLSQLRHFIKNDTLESLSGDMKLNIAFAGKVKDLPRVDSEHLYKVQASGSILLSNVEFRLKHNPLEFKNINGNFTLHDNDIAVNMLKGNISSSDVQVTGLFRNFINFIFIPNQPAVFNAKLSGTTLNLDELMANKATTTSSDTSYILKFNPRLVSDLQVSMGTIIFRQFRAYRFQGPIHLDHQVITGRGVTFSAMDGMVYMDATINASRKDSVFMNFDSKISRLDVNKLFIQMENFGQNTMTDKNVKGRVSADVQFASAWTTDFSIDSKKVRSTADITIENGELNEFTPIQALAKYIKVPDLNHIRFSTLHNQISISNRIITVPMMEIKSSALNLNASGTHNFDNIVDYRLRLMLSDILGKKAKQNSEFGEIEDDGLGRTQLLLSMKGPVDDPKFAYDRKGTQEKIKTDIVKEKQNLKGILKEEFGLFKKDTAAVEKKKKKEELQIDWNNEQ